MQITFFRVATFVPTEVHQSLLYATLGFVDLASITANQTPVP